MAERHDPGSIPDGDGFDDVEVFDLDSLTDDVRPTTAQWSAISAAARQRRSRRTGLLGAAAAVVLILIVATVLVVDRSGNDSITVASGGRTGEQRTYVLPPDGATINNLSVEGESSSIWYSSDDGDRLLLRSDAVSDMVAGTAVERAENLAYMRRRFSAFETQIPPLGEASIACSVYGIDESPYAADEKSFAGPIAVTSLRNDALLVLTPESPTGESCTPPTDASDPIVSQAELLRVVDRAEWEAFLRDNGVDPSDPEELADPGSSTTASTLPSTPDFPPSTTTTVAPGGEAQAQIAAALAGLGERAPDGSYPNLEDGTKRAAEYQRMFDLATRQSGASEIPDRPDTAFTLTSMQTTSPDVAAIQFSAEAELPTGTFSFGASGTAIRQDGRWVISYDTIRQLLDRACIPPGGGTPACDGAGGGGG